MNLTALYQLLTSNMPSPAKNTRLPTSQPAFFSLQVRAAQRFYLNLAPPANRRLAVVCGGCEHCAPDYAIHRPTFPYYSIEVVVGGRGTLTLAGGDFALLPGTVFSYGPGVSHDIATSAADPLVKYFVDFTGRQALRLLRQHELAPGSVRRVPAPGEIQELCDALIENGLRNSRFSSRICDSLLECLVLKIAELLVPGDAIQSPAFATYQRCRQHIQTHSGKLKTLAQVARQCHVDPAYLCRLFHRYDHQTPYQFLMRLKMNQAAGRLGNPGTLVKQVAADLNFDDACHFSRAFKNIFGVSPEAFRQLRGSPPLASG
jgi:AraC-like DNA-binding protein